MPQDVMSHQITKRETDLLSQKEAARVLGVTRETVSRWTSAGTIACIRFGRRGIAYPHAEIVRHARSRRAGKGGKR